MFLLVLILVFAAAAGFLGDLLEFALWAILFLIAIGALAGYLLYRLIAGMPKRDRT